MPVFSRTAILDASQVYFNKGLNAVVPLLLIPFFTSVFGVQQYGELVKIQAISILLIYVTDFGLSITATRDASLIGQDKGAISRLASSVFSIKLLLTTLAILGICGIAWIANWDAAYWVLFSLVFAALSLQNLMPAWLFQGMHRNGFITAANLVSKCVLLLLVYGFLAPGDPLWEAPFYESVAYSVYLAIGIGLLFWHYKIRISLPSRADLLGALRGSKDYFLTNVLSWWTTGGVLLVVEQLVEPTEFGYYATFTRIVYYVFALLQPINLALLPYATRQFSTSVDKGHALLKKVAGFYGIAVITILVGAFALGPWFFGMAFDDEFNSDLPKYVATYYWLVAWVCLVLWNNFVGLQYLLGQRKDHLYSKYYIANVVVSFVLAAALTPALGIVGAAISSTIGELCLTALLMRTAMAQARPSK